MLYELSLPPAAAEILIEMFNRGELEEITNLLEIDPASGDELPEAIYLDQDLDNSLGSKETVLELNIELKIIIEMQFIANTPMERDRVIEMNYNKIKLLIGGELYTWLPLWHVQVAQDEPIIYRAHFPNKPGLYDFQLSVDEIVIYRSSHMLRNGVNALSIDLARAQNAQRRRFGT